VEVYQRFSDQPLTECGVCGGPLRKVFHPAGILFKGTGFYKTDSRPSRTSTAAGDGAGSKTAAETGSTTAVGKGSKARSGDSKTSSSGAESGSSGAGGKEQSA
jgi:predicted nucleic acid-binding Zn ribbon protein